MERKHIIRTVGYLLLIWIGYIAGEYPRIPSFTLGFYHHLQPSQDIIDKGTAVTLLALSMTILFALWNNIWIMISMIFITWGMFNNFIDEMNDTATIFTTNEQISLLFALLTTSILIWRHRRK